MSTIVIKEVTSRSMLKTFIDFPTHLLKHYPAFTPAIFEDELQNLNPKKNPAHRYCDTKLFLAYQNNKVVGRVCGIINHYSNTKYKEKRLRFNRIDFIEDYDVFESLMHGLKTYALANQLDTLVGPLGFSDQDKEGLLTEGFDERNMFVTLYSPSYYVGFFERYGFVKDATWNEYQIKVPLRIPEHLLRVVERIQERHDFRLVTIPKKNKSLLGPYIKKILALMNLTYGHLYGYVPVEEELMDHLVNQYLPLIQLDYLQLIVDSKNDLIAFGLMIPSPVMALKKHDGHLFPFGFIDFFSQLKSSKVLDMLLVAVHPDYKQTGVLAMIFVEGIKQAIKHKIDYAETGPELAYNQDIQSLWKHFETRHHKSRSAFIKKITP
jgi:hypothetical protein